MVNSPVGVAIAMRRKQDGFTPATERTKAKKDQATPAKGKPSSWQVLCEGTVMYLGCLVLPSLLGYLYRIYKNGLLAPPAASDAYVAPSLAGSAYSLGSYYYESLLEQVCPAPGDVDSGSYTAYVCPSVQSSPRHTALYSQDTAWSDVQLVSVLSLMLAVCRGLLVHYLVPRDYESLQALLRCKSNHMLSKDYYSVSPSASRLNLPAAAMEDRFPWDDDDAVGLRFDESERELSMPGPKTGGAPSATDAAKAQLQLAETDLYSAPRCATALFRLLYSASAIVLAYVSFHDADFWPWYVLGRGATRNCWDLSGGLTLGMDSDFDQCNSRLRRYFLWQASYHWHSGAFHVWSLAMLLRNPGGAGGTSRRFLSVSAGTAGYLRSMLQHTLLLLSIGTAYVFSSLRRLGAIGMFAFDVSSFSLHLLQLCTNAHETSPLRRSEVVRRVYYGAVLPSYVAARFLVWPMLWYSATFESDQWLRQFEQTLVPGSARVLRGAVHLLMALLLGTTVVHLRRLRRHPQVLRALRPVR